MIKFLNNSQEEINEVIELTAQRKQLNTVIVEKDLWVSYLLDYLFNRCIYKDYFEFKGGTSLSKAYFLIDRFSEDVDIVLDTSVLGIDLYAVMNLESNNQKTKMAEKINDEASNFITTKLIPVLENDLNKETGKDFEIRYEKKELAVYIKYPSSHNDPYIRSEVKLEIGPLAAWTPFELKDISSFVCEEYPELFDKELFIEIVTKPVRTFWEKSVILHQEAHRENKDIPRRYSRHYYDVHKMYYSFVKQEALNNIDLLSEVREFTKTFYNRSWSKFDDAKPGTFKLYPNNSFIDALKEDYESMKVMIYKDAPEFEDILVTIKKLEKEINQQQ